jgi:hypothetical protein
MRKIGAGLIILVLATVVSASLRTSIAHGYRAEKDDEEHDRILSIDRLFRTCRRHWPTRGNSSTSGCASGSGVDTITRDASF